MLYRSAKKEGSKKMDDIDLEGIMRKEYKFDGTIAVHLDYCKEAHGTLTVSRDDEPILNDLLQMLKSRADRINLMAETIRELDSALRNGNDLSKKEYNDIYEDSIGRSFAPIGDERDNTIAELRNEVSRLNQRLIAANNKPRTTRRRNRAA